MGWLLSSSELVEPPTAGSKPGEKYIFGPASKQRPSYASWPLAGSSVKSTNHYLITFDNTDKNKSIFNIVGPPSRPRSSSNLYWLLPAPLLLVEASWNVMAHAHKPDFVFRRNGRVHLNRRGASVQSTTVSRGVRISGSNAGYTMFRGSVKRIGYPLHSPVSSSLPLPCVTMCHHISTGL